MKIWKYFWKFYQFYLSIQMNSCFLLVKMCSVNILKNIARYLAHRKMWKEQLTGCTKNTQQCCIWPAVYFRARNCNDTWTRRVQYGFEPSVGFWWLFLHVCSTWNSRTKLLIKIKLYLTDIKLESYWYFVLHTRKII